MLTRIHFGLLALADQSGMKFSLWGYFWYIIWRILTDMKLALVFHKILQECMYENVTYGPLHILDKKDSHRWLNICNWWANLFFR